MWPPPENEEYPTTDSGMINKRGKRKVLQNQTVSKKMIYAGFIILF